MKVLFLQKDTMVKVAVMLLSAMLQEDGHESDVLIGAAEKHLVETAVAIRPDIVAFSSTTGTEGWILDTAAKIKSRLDVPVLIGGPHATFFPDIISNPQVDIVCRGEGEEAIRDIVRALAEEPEALASIPNVWVERDGEIVRNDVRPLRPELDDLPLPDWDLYRRRYSFLVPYYQGNFPAIMSRGCPYGCSYCFNRAYQQLYKGKGRYVRRETPEVAVRKLVRMREEFGIRRFNFVDDSFADSATWLREFVDLYRAEVGLPFICNVRADTITEETASLLADAGCYCVRMGIESGNDRVRHEILNKRVSEEEIRNAATLARANRMKLTTFNMYGSPSETLDEALSTYELNRDLRVTFAQCSILQPYPGTKIRARAEEMGLLEPVGAGSQGDVGESYFVASPLRMENKREITNLQKLTQTFVRFRVPTPIVRRIISMPENRLFHMAFQAEYALFRFGLDLKETIPFLRFALRSRAYMARSSKKPARRVS